MSSMPPAADAPPVPRWVRQAAGHWQVRAAGVDDARAFEPLPALRPGDTVCIDGSGLRDGDLTVLAVLHAVTTRLQALGVAVRWVDLPAGAEALLRLPAAPGPAGGGAGPGATVPTTGADAEALAVPARLSTVAFLGDVLLALAGRRGQRPPGSGRELLRQLDEVGPQSLGIVALACGLVGLMLAYMGGAQLVRMGAQSFLAEVVAVGMVRELAGLMTGVLLAGRVGAAIAARLASMNLSEEIDALEVLGVDRVRYLVLPRLGALLVVTPALTIVGAAAGILAGWPAASLAYGLGGAEYFGQAMQALTFTHVWIGLFKCVVYGLLVGIAGCVEGLRARRSAEAVGQATTRAVVRALVWIVTAACATTVVFTALGY